MSDSTFLSCLKVFDLTQQQQRYGAPCLTDELRAQGYHFNVKPWQQGRTEQTAQDIIGRVRTASL